MFASLVRSNQLFLLYLRLFVYYIFTYTWTYSAFLRSVSSTQNTTLLYLATRIMPSSM